MKKASDRIGATAFASTLVLLPSRYRSIFLAVRRRFHPGRASP
jgi:hypothetical protein